MTEVMNPARAAHLAELAYAGVEEQAKGLIPSTPEDGLVVLIDGSMFSPSTRAVAHAGEVWDSDDQDAWVMFEDTFDDLCNRFADTHDFYSLDWEEGMLIMHGPNFGMEEE